MSLGPPALTKLPQDTRMASKISDILVKRNMNVLAGPPREFRDPWTKKDEPLADKASRKISANFQQKIEPFGHRVE